MQEDISMQNIYFDQASSCFPRPKIVCDTVYDCLLHTGINVNRSAAALSYSLEERIFDCREKLANLFHAPSSRNVVFTKNVTESLNIVLKGLLSPGDHVLTSSLEHNAVIRPLVQLKEQGISYSLLHCDKQGNLDLEDIFRKIQPNTRALVLTHASNVCGSVLPIAQVGKLCQEIGLIFIVDTAQSAGLLPIDMQSMHIDILCFTGHKSLLGPQGVGGIVFAGTLYKQVRPLLAGGTGSISDSLTMPDFLPDKFEAGTPNVAGILGLSAGLDWLKKKGIEQILSHELDLCQHFLQGLAELKIAVLGKSHLRDRLAVVSIQLEEDMALIAHKLEENYGIITRVGLHCAPIAHQTLGSYPRGSIRFSFGYFNTLTEVEYALQALKELVWN